MAKPSEFGTLKHFGFYMLLACLTGAALGVASVIWDWSYTTVRWASAVAVLVVVSIALGPVALRTEASKPRASARPGSEQAS